MRGRVALRRVGPDGMRIATCCASEFLLGLCVVVCVLDLFEGDVGCEKVVERLECRRG